MSFLKWFKSAKAKAFVFLGSFAMLLGVGATVTVSAATQTNEVVETKAASAAAPCTYVLLSDESGNKFTSDGIDPVLRLHSFTWASNTVISSASACVSAGYNSASSPYGQYWWESGGVLFIKMKWKGWSGSNRQYEVRIPWFIQSCSFNLIVQSGGQDRPVKYREESGYWQQTFSCGDSVTVALKDHKDYGSNWNGHYKVGDVYYAHPASSSTEQADYYTVSFNTNGGSSVGNQTVWKKGKAVKPDNPTKTCYSFYRWTSDSGGNTEYDFSSEVTSTKMLYAQWKAPIQSTFRIWLWRSTHFANSNYEWKIWDGVDNSTPISATGYAQIHADSSIYLAYFDVPTSISYVVFQVFTTAGAYQAGAAKASSAYTAGDNAYIWYPTATTGNVPNMTLTMAKNGTPASFSDKVDASVLQLVFSAYFTCRNDKNNGYKIINTVYSTWVWGSSTSRVYNCTTQSQCNTLLSNTTIPDYNYNGGSYSYTSMSGRTVSTNLYAKYTAMDNMRTKGRVSSALSMPSATDSSPLTLTLWIVLGAGLAGMAAIGAAYVVSKKKKKRHQA